MSYATYGERPQAIEQGLDLGDDWDETEVKAVVQRELDDAMGQDGGTLARERLHALRFYEGHPFGNEVEGRSQVVMRSVLEAVEWVLPALIRIFTASDKICVVEPGQLPPPPQQQMMMGAAPPPDPEVLARQATDYVNHIFQRDNPGFMILHDWFKDALLEKLGWVKYWWDTQQTVETQTYTGLTRAQLDALVGQDEDVEIIKERRYRQEVDEFLMDRPNPAPVPVELIDVTLRIRRDNGRVRIENVPPEEVLFSRRAKRGDVPFLAHRRRWTYSDLIEQGYDEECLDLVPMDDSMEWNAERVERFREADGYPPDERKDAARQIWVEENYVRLSRDNKTTELYKVMSAGKGAVILTRDGEACIDCVDEMPFVSICPIPLPHRLVGLSLADLTMDLQEIKSSIIRQMIDNAYLTNWPRIEVADDVVSENTIDDLLTLRPGGMVRTRRSGGINPMMIPYTADKSFPLVEYLDQVQEVRTGVARHNQGINPDDLNKTATGVSLLQQAAAQRVELFARIFAHGVEQLMRGIMGLVRRHQQQERIIRVTGGWLRIDPRLWRDEMPVTVSVGLGTGNRDQVLAHLMTVIQLQGTIVQQQQGVNGPLVYAQNVYDALQQLQENAGFKASFFTDPSKPPPMPQGMSQQQPPQPNPAVIVAQAQVQATQMKAQAGLAAAQAKAQSDAQIQQQKAQLDAQLAQQAQQHQLMLEAQKAQHQMDLEQQQAQHDLVIARAKVEAEAQLAQREVELKYAAGAYAAGRGGLVGPPNGGGLPGA